MSAVFDGLAGIYDRQRPRYPDAVFALLVSLLPADHPVRILDAGSGPGVILEGLIPRLPPHPAITAVDVSTDMLATGRAKFPAVEWVHAPVEEELERRFGLSLITAGQSAHWFDRPRFYRAARAALVPGGALAIVQNNREYSGGGFAAGWEDFVERHDPGYRRDYRDFPYATELPRALGGGPGDAGILSQPWTLTRSAEDTRGRALSSSKIRGALRLGGAAAEADLAELIAEHTVDGNISMSMKTEVFWARTPREDAEG